MAERKAISKKVRFEIFKRDSFRCQYCGKSAPDVTLNVDHIKPVAGGGSNHPTNLITSCFDCNSGKNDRSLGDNSMLEKQKKQLDELNERRLQLEMMMKWRDGLMDLNKDKMQMVMKRFSTLTGYDLTDSAKKTFEKTIKKYELGLILDSLEDAANQYLVQNRKDGKFTQESASKTFDYIPKICASKLKMIEKPYLKEIYYIVSIAKKKYNYFIDWKAMNAIEKAYLNGYSKATLLDIVNESKNWTQYIESMESILEGVG